MLKRILPLICLSFIGCAKDPADYGLPDKPPGWHCGFFYNEQAPADSKFYCNGMRNPDNAKEMTLAEAMGAQCMPVETFEKYTAYIEEIKKVARKKCN